MQYGTILTTEARSELEYIGFMSVFKVGLLYRGVRGFPSAICPEMLGDGQKTMPTVLYLESHYAMDRQGVGGSWVVKAPEGEKG